jgi:dTDP-4-amino-4,6-dideoxygalactose transaminase
MGEMEAAIASEQLRKLEPRIASRQAVAAQLNAGLQDLPGLATPVVAPGCTHVYYIYGLKLDAVALGVPRQRIVDALKCEGVPGLLNGYQNLHLLPTFRHRIAYGSKGFPWTSPYCDSDVRYGPGLCPVAEQLHTQSFFGLNLCMYEFAPADVELVITAFRKVWDRLPDLRS